MSERMLSCAETFQRLEDYLDRELSPAHAAEVEVHLERCAMCAGEFAVERDLLDKIRGKLERAVIPRDLKAKIAALLDQA